MAKNVKLNVKNTQLADAINLSGLKAKLKKRSGAAEEGSAELEAPVSAKGSQEKTETQAQQHVQVQQDVQKSKKPPRPKSKPDSAQSLAPESMAHQAPHGDKLESKAGTSEVVKASPQKAHVSKTHEPKQHESKQVEPQDNKVADAESGRSAPRTRQETTLRKDNTEKSASDLQPSPKVVHHEESQTTQEPVATPLKKIPTLPSSMRNDEASGMRLGPVQTDSTPTQAGRDAPRKDREFRARDDRSPQSRQGDSRGPRSGGTSGGTTGSSYAKPFEPFKDRARGIQPFTTPQPKPAPRPRLDSRTDASRGEGQRSDFRPGSSGAPRNFESRSPNRDFGRDGGREGFRSQSDQPASDQPRSADRPYVDRPPSDRPYGDRPPRAPYAGDRPQGDRPPRAPYAGDRPYGDRPPRAPYAGDRPQGDRPPRAPYAGDRPYGDRPPRAPYAGDRPQGDRPPRAPYAGDRPYGDRPPRAPYAGDRPFGDRPPRPPFGGPRREGSGFQPSGFAGGPRRDTLRGVQPVIPTNRPEKEGARVIEEDRKPKVIRERTNQPPRGIKRAENKDDARVRHGYVATGEGDEVWRKKRPSKSNRYAAESYEVVRPQAIAVRIPTSVKDLAEKMKLKASQLIANLFLQGIIVTLNDMLDDETTIQLLGQEFGCEISIDTRVEDKMRVTGKSVSEEIKETDAENLIIRPPVVAFMGHVDHGKTSLIDAIRKSNRVKSEVGAITQHIGAFQCLTAQGPITILDTPGHEAFSAMRERGAEITDIVVLVVAGDEGMKEQTVEALNQARTANTTIVVAINKCDKPNFDQEKVYRQLAENNLLPEAWGGQTVTVNCSATTGEGISALVEMLALQSEVLELRASTAQRARGRVVESQMQKGMGSVATLLVQNGTLRVGDCLVFDCEWAKVKTMRNDAGKEVLEAGPSMPVLITGLSALPSAGEEFIVVGSEKDAKEIAAMRNEGRKQTTYLKKRQGLESMLQKGVAAKKVLNVILRADVQGSLEALKTALEKIHSDKVELNIISISVGEISESDVQLAATSKATLLGFHTQIESHAESLIKSLGVTVRQHNIIYHAVDDVRDLMRALLDKIAQETDKGRAEVKATFKSSHLGIIAGCQVIEGTIARNCHIRLRRDGKEIWRGPMSSLKRFKDDVREVSKGFECGIVLQGYEDYLPGDILEAFEVTYLSQDL